MISGVIATTATIPKADSSTESPPLEATQAPIAMGRIKLDVRGPDATPPESNAIAVYSGGIKKLSPRLRI